MLYRMHANLGAIHRAKIGPNFCTGCSEGSKSASSEDSDQRKCNPPDFGTASHAEGRWPPRSDISDDHGGSAE